MHCANKYLIFKADLPTLQVLKIEDLTFSSQQNLEIFTKNIRHKSSKSREAESFNKGKNSTAESPLHKGTVSLNLIKPFHVRELVKKME